MNYCMVNGAYQAVPNFPGQVIDQNQATTGLGYQNTTANCEYTVTSAPSTSSPSCDSVASNPSSMELVHMNGRKVLGPPENWVGPPPSSVCELYIRRIPRDLNEQKLLAPFLRFGQIYEIRLPMDFNQTYRGYAYVKYTNEEEASRAMEVLNHYYILPGRKLEILHSYEKCRLFVTNIPRHLEEHEIEDKLRTIFPSMQRIYTRPCSWTDHQFRDGDGQMKSGVSTPPQGSGNRGHVFVHFATHMHALEAKKNATPGLIRMWDRDLKVVWANTERECNSSNASKTLFVRNVDLTVNNRDIINLLVKHVPRTTVCKISKVRTTAFFDFTTREAAEVCLKQLQGVMLREKCLDVEWAKPSEQQSLHRMRETDFDAVLRLKCIANDWHIPVVIFGCYYEQEHLQYGVVVLRDALDNVRATFCIFNTNELVDIHSRMCEVVCVLIETIGAFPDYNYVFLVEKDTAHLLGMVTLNQMVVDFMAACGVPHDFFFDFNELIDLSSAVMSLTFTSEESLLAAYKESFLTRNECTYLKNWPLVAHRIFGTIMPKYRNKDPLKYNLNDTQIVLALCFKITGTNAATRTRPYMAFRACTFDQGYEGLRYISMKLLPVALTQSRFQVSHILSHVEFGGSHYYHPDRRYMLPPMWITGCAYAKSVKQPKGNVINTTLEETTPSNQNIPQQMQISLGSATYVPQPPPLTHPQAVYMATQQHNQPIMSTTPSGMTTGGLVHFSTHPNVGPPTLHGYVAAAP